MILTTGGRASGATSTRSSPRSCAAARASSIVRTPNWSPLSAITRTGLMRICRLTRVRGALLLLSNGGRCRFSSVEPMKKRISCARRDPLPKPSAISRQRLADSRRLTADGRDPYALSQERRAGGAHRAHLVATNLVKRHRLHKCDPLALPRQPARHDRRVVLEDQQPPL